MLNEMLSEFCRRQAASKRPEDYGFNVEWNLAGDMAAALEAKLEAIVSMAEELEAYIRFGPALDTDLQERWWTAHRMANELRLAAAQKEKE